MDTALYRGEIIAWLTRDYFGGQSEGEEIEEGRGDDRILALGCAHSCTC